MAKSSANGAAKRTKKPTPTWHELAAETDSKRALWVRGRNHTDFVACGEDWQAVCVKPIELGLDALAAMRIGTRRGYLIVADHLRGVLYVMVPPGNGEAFAGIPGVRVLGRGHQLLMPRTTQDSSTVADWVGIPRTLDVPVLVDPDRLAARLQELARSYEEAMAS
ncbi:hypothetical protein J7I98_37040 [Streptomyces sp. ISL-98]|uniref:hypothetical protein n=1 Tax=Streptomyces sp. ISL-98 TaxID=2819192 RepID=UPI001BE7A7AE|nr:hypothetical protein [Streptomyces sp. ISL-98]MBT2511329.1 hypothetical protein [Streptomyces sp. ISL-98]